MFEIKSPVSFLQLIKDCERIEVPLIQRDYAQGRESQKDVRNDFLDALQKSLGLQAGKSKLPLNLDFVYGSMEAGASPRFLPLDGQQRLTTLYLLHWYLAWCDGQLLDFRTNFLDGNKSRFTYGVRPSSTEFFDALVAFDPDGTPNDMSSVRKMLEDQPWFFLHWRLDPTIQSVLTMLDAIHERFRESDGLYALLVNEKQPAITFHLLPLEHFGLSDDLYIKMNARGKPLTAFETFKARFEELLKELFPTETRKIAEAEMSVPVFFERRMDTQWTNFFWRHQQRTFDDAALNLMWALVRISLDPESPNFAKDTGDLGSRFLGAGFTLFHERCWLTKRFADHLMDLLEAWSAGDSGLTKQLHTTHNFDEVTFFQKAITSPSAFTYFELVQFAAFVIYLTHHRGAVQPDSLREWMRIVKNLSANSDIERPEEFGRSLAGLQKLLPYSGEILPRLASMATEQLGFSPQQLREEMLKAKLILAAPNWRASIEEAEKHGYFSGQIEFLLDFSGVSAKASDSAVSDWGADVHFELQNSFDAYLKKAQITFDAKGLIRVGPSRDTHLWKRALLVIDDYLLPVGNNFSFLTNPANNAGSWKRFLRGSGSGVQHRRHLKALWDRLDANVPIEPQLNKIIDNAQISDPWRAAIVSHPAVIDYCGQQEIRRTAGGDEIYLMTKREMTGYHAELFSYTLYLDLSTDASRASLKPMTLGDYSAVYGSYAEPSLQITLKRATCHVIFEIESSGGQFQIRVNCTNLASDPEVEACLRGQAGFSENGSLLRRVSSREKIFEELWQLARILATIPEAMP